MTLPIIIRDILVTIVLCHTIGLIFRLTNGPEALFTPLRNTITGLPMMLTAFLLSVLVEHCL